MIPTLISCRCLNALAALLALAYALTLRADSGLTTTSVLNSASEQAYTNVIVGTWEENGVRITLRSDGSYEWWAPHLQSDLKAKTRLQTGTWSVRGRTLLLHCEKAFLPNGGEGMLVTNDIVSVSSNEVLLISRIDKRGIRWARVSAQAEPFWESALSYEPPFKMSSYLHSPDAGTDVGDWELYSTGMGGGTNGAAKVVFHLGTVAEFVGSDRPAKLLKTVADLKAFMDAESETNPPGSGRLLLSIGSVGGREALTSITPTNRVPGKPIEWQGGVCFFWEVKPVWQNSTICSVTITAETRETFNLLTNSLKTIKMLGGKQRN